jgi:hypothetical protein
MSRDLIKRLRAAAHECDTIDTRYDSVPIVDWEYLFIEAADALQEYEDDEPYNVDEHIQVIPVYVPGPRKPDLYLVNDDPNHSRGVNADQRGN